MLNDHVDVVSARTNWMQTCIAGNRISCDYGESRFTNQCVQMISAAPENS